MIEGIAALASLVGQLVPLIIKAVNAPAEEHAQIVADAQTAVAAFVAAVDALPAAVAADNAQADAAVDAANK